MTLADARSLERVAQRLVVEARRGVDSPPAFEPEWQPVWAAKVQRIVINHGAKPSTATVWFPDMRWDADIGLLWADMIRIRTDEWAPSDRTILFVGFITGYLSDFSGGTEQAKPYERNAIVCQDHRWLLAASSPIFGQVARSPDDYYFYGTASQVPKDNSWTALSGRRAIFNADGKPNSDPYALVLEDSVGVKLCEVPIFANPSNDPDIAIPWTAKDMIRYMLCRMWNRAYDYLPIPDPNELAGLDHEDWAKVLNHIVVEGLNIVDAVQLVCKHIGWSFREEYSTDGEVTLVFYKVGDAEGYVRDDDHQTILHELHAPGAGENIAAAIAAGRKPLWSMSLAEDISSVVNNPAGLGAPDRFEFTAELIPAWLDTDLSPDTSDDNAHLFLTEADLQNETDPNLYSYYGRYHPRGSQFRRNVGRKWVLNESSLYTLSPYDRGMPFDFSTVIPPEHILDRYGRRLFAPCNRQLLPCLTLDEANLNSVGIRVEFSFDGGTTWQVIPAAIACLKDECGIYISEANLAELVDQAEGAISGGTLDEVQLNVWTSLCDDKLNSRSFKNNEWRTRIRVTASVQMDRRLTRQSLPSRASGSPFEHIQIYDLSEKYGFVERTPASIFDAAGLPVYQQPYSVAWLENHLDGIRKANEDMSISGRFTLERLWLGDGRGEPDFKVGDCIERLSGREYPLSSSFGGGVVYPEIVQIVYLPDKQKMQLITRDLRFAQVVL